jgi:hypothetical protein
VPKAKVPCHKALTDLKRRRYMPYVDSTIKRAREVWRQNSRKITRGEQKPFDDIKRRIRGALAALLEIAQRRRDF